MDTGNFIFINSVHENQGKSLSDHCYYLQKYFKAKIIAFSSQAQITKNRIVFLFWCKSMISKEMNFCRNVAKLIFVRQ